MINMLKAPVGTEENIKEQIGNVNRNGNSKKA